MQVLFEGYYAAGIDEYWLIDARGEAIEFEIFVRGTDGYIPVVADAEGYRHSGVFDLSFKLSRSTNRITHSPKLRLEFSAQPA